MAVMNAINFEREKFELESEIDSEDEESILKFCNTSIWEDLWSSLYDARFAGPFVALLGIIVAFHITIAPYRVHSEARDDLLSTSLNLDLHSVRPLIEEGRMRHIRNLLLHAETEIELPTFESIKFKFHTTSDNFGSQRLPSMFYDGVTFGITSLNPHNIDHTSFSKYTQEDLEKSIHELKPNPTFVMKRAAVSNDTMWEESGFAVYYSYSALEGAGKLGADTQKPWKRIANTVLDLARDYKQAYITVWYPIEFGSRPGNEKDRYRHRAILQEVLPTRTGLDGVKCSSVVWMTTVDGISPHLLDFVQDHDW